MNLCLNLWLNVKQLKDRSSDDDHWILHNNLHSRGFINQCLVLCIPFREFTQTSAVKRLPLTISGSQLPHMLISIHSLFFHSNSQNVFFNFFSLVYNEHVCTSIARQSSSAACSICLSNMLQYNENTGFKPSIQVYRNGVRHVNLLFGDLMLL